MKVKRGLGLLVVAVIAFLLAVAIVQTATGHSDAADLVAWSVVLGLALGCLAAGLAGLVLVAWGLLRD